MSDKNNKWIPLFDSDGNVIEGNLPPDRLDYAPVQVTLCSSMDRWIEKVTWYKSGFFYKEGYITCYKSKNFYDEEFNDDTQVIAWREIQIPQPYKPEVKTNE